MVCVHLVWWRTASVKFKCQSFPAKFPWVSYVSGKYWFLSVYCAHHQGPAADVHLNQHQGAARLLVRHVWARRRPGGQRPPHPRPPGGYARDRPVPGVDWWFMTFIIYMPCVFFSEVGWLIWEKWSSESIAFKTDSI